MRLAHGGADSAWVAHAVVLTWAEIETALSPVLGKGGTHALYKRSVSQIARDHPWMGSPASALSTLDPEALGAMLGQRPSAEAAEVGAALLLAFHDLLTKLVGPALSQRLLRSCWTHLSIAPPTQEDAP